MPRYLGRHPTEPERDSIDNLKDVDTTTTTPNATNKLLVFDNSTSKFTPGPVENANSFGTVVVAGQDNIEADSTNDTLTFVAGTDITLSTDATTDTVTITSTAAGGGSGSVSLANPSGDGTFDDGAIIANTSSMQSSDYNSFVVDKGLSSGDNFNNTVDKINEVMQNIAAGTFVRSAKFTIRAGANPNSAEVTEASQGDELYGHIDDEVFGNGSNPNQYIWDWGDGLNDTVTTTTPLAHTFAAAAGPNTGAYTVSLTAKNTNAKYTDSHGSQVKFTNEDALTSYTPKPRAKLEYQFTQVDNSQIGFLSTTPQNIDEAVSAGSGTGSSVSITFKIDSEQLNGQDIPWHYYAIRIEAGNGTYSYLPNSIGATEWNYTTANGTDIATSWEAKATNGDTTVATTLSATDTQDEEFTIECKVFSTSANPADALDELNNNIKLRLMRYYQGLTTFTATSYNNTLTGNNNEADDNLKWAQNNTKPNPTNYQSAGMIVDVSSFGFGALTFAGAFGSKLDRLVGGVTDNQATNSDDQIVFLPKVSNTGADQNVTLDYQITNQHTSSPFSSATGQIQTFTVQNDPRAAWSFVFDSPSTGYTGQDVKKGFIITDYTTGVSKARVTFDATTSENVNNYKWYFDSAGNLTFDLNNPDATAASSPHTYTTAQTYSVGLVAIGPNSELHAFQANQDDTEEKNDSIIISTAPNSVAGSLTGQNLTLENIDKGGGIADNQIKLVYNFTDNKNTATLTKNPGDIIPRKKDNATFNTTKTSFISSFPGDGNKDSVAKAYLNSSTATNTHTLTTNYPTTNPNIENDNTQTHLEVSDGKDENGEANTIPLGLYRVIKLRFKSGNIGTDIQVGYNVFKLGHQKGTDAETNTNEFGMVIDDVTDTPILDTAAVTLTETTPGTLKYVSGVPYYSTGNPALSASGVKIYNFIGQTYYDGNDIVTIEQGTDSESQTGDVLNASNSTYADIDGSTTMLNGGNPIKDTGKDVNNKYDLGDFSISLSPNGKAVKPLTIKGKNVNGVGTSTDLSTTKIVVYQSALTGLDNELNIGGQTGKRIEGFATTQTNTPAISSTDYYTGSPFSNTTTVGGTYEAITRFGTIKQDRTDYSTGYLPAGPDMSHITSGYVFYTFAFTAPAIQSFDIQLNTTGGVSGMWVGLPGISNITSSATWWDTTQVYPGSGVPGAGGTGGNTSDACAKNSSVKLTPNTTGTNSVGITFGTENSANSTGNNVLVRIALSQNQSISGITLTLP